MGSIGQRIRQLREQKSLSQGDIERSTGMLRAYISRVEHGHTVPSLESLERFAAALGIPLYQLFCYTPGAEQEAAASLPVSEKDREDEKFLLLLKGCVHGMEQGNRELLLSLARRLAGQ
jgi:transcriptional regulator with XRE-family HTH domain